MDEVAVNALIVPPERVMSPSAKVDDASDSVKVIVSVWPTVSVPVPPRETATVGAVLSIVTVRPEDVDVTVESDRIVVDCAVMTLSPAVRTAVSHVHAPVVLLAVHVFPDDTPSTKSCTVDPTGAEPVNVNVVEDVMLSVLVPVSSAASRSGVEAAGTE